MCVASTPGEIQHVLGMQSIGFMRSGMDYYVEVVVARFHGISDMRKAAEKDPSVKEKTNDKSESPYVLTFLLD